MPRDASQQGGVAQAFNADLFEDDIDDEETRSDYSDGENDGENIKPDGENNLKHSTTHSLSRRHRAIGAFN